MDRIRPILCSLLLVAPAVQSMGKAHPLDVAIIGAGISGLCSTYRLEQAEPSANIHDHDRISWLSIVI